jgi:hypothetical protein
MALSSRGSNGSYLLVPRKASAKTEQIAVIAAICSQSRLQITRERLNKGAPLLLSVTAIRPFVTQGP